MTRLYARARRGVRISEATPQSHWKILTIIGAMSTSVIRLNPAIRDRVKSGHPPALSDD
jgi:hypothetical protein